LGYGNPLRGDDGAGWRVAEAIAERWAHKVLVRTAQQPLAEWAADLSEADVAYFVDASVSTLEPRLQRLAIAPEVIRVASHDLDPAQILHLTHVVYGRTPRGFAVHVPAVDFEFSESLSTVASGGVRAAVCLLNNHISHLEG
jgi:hydrogenase maturation protease